MNKKKELEIQRKARELAEEHWEWVERWLHMVYVDAFVHGCKHSVDFAPFAYYDEGEKRIKIIKDG